MDLREGILCGGRLYYLWFSFKHKEGGVTNYLLQKGALGLMWLGATILSEQVLLKKFSSICHPKPGPKGPGYSKGPQ